MAVIRQTKSTTLFRCLVVPTMLLCGIFRKPILQWIALGAVAVWLVVTLMLHFGQKRQRSRRTKALRLSEPATVLPAMEVGRAEPDDQELFLLRQINYRITEQLKQTYPMISWLWDPRPSVEDLCRGGTWRIQLSNAEPFNYGDVEITKLGKISITLLQAVPLGESLPVAADAEDLTDSELLERVDVKAWYLDEGEQLLSQIIDNLNTQGHREILVKEDGSVCIKSSSAGELVVDSVMNFPPRKTWNEFCQLLSEDEITASVKPASRCRAWN